MLPPAGPSRRPTQLSCSTLEPEAHENAPEVPDNFPARMEAVRNHGTVAKARAKLALAKAADLKTDASSARLMFYERAIDLELAMREQRRVAAHATLELPLDRISTELRDKAEETYSRLMERIPSSLNVRELLDRLIEDSPDLEELDAVPAVIPVNLPMPSPRDNAASLEGAPPSDLAGALPDNPVDAPPPPPSLW